MVVQQSFSFISDYVKTKKLKTLSDLPSYKKRYVVYAYDTDRYRSIWNKLKQLSFKFQDENIFLRVNPYRVLDHCYIKDKKGKKKYLGDSHHIYRIKTLHKIYKAIADEIFCHQLKLHLGEWKIITDGVCIFLDDDLNQAEIIGTEHLPLSKRLKIHIELLRQLKQGTKLKKAVRIAKKRIKRKAKEIL